MAKHKNFKDAVGNFVIYIISLFSEIFKIGKADGDRVTVSSGQPTRIHQQLRKLTDQYGKDAVGFEIVEELNQTSTENSLQKEQDLLDDYYQDTGKIPEGNRKSYKPKKKQ